MSWTRKKVLLTVKAYPTTSKRYGATYCAAGVTEDGEWIRLYPMSFHDYLRRKLKRYTWIEVECKKDTKEKIKRKESHKVREGTIKILDISFTSGDGRKKYWRKRNNLILPLVSPSIRHLKDMNESDRTSLGLIKPKLVTEFTFRPPPEGIDEKTGYYQMDIEGKRVPTPDPFPTAKYHFHCSDECSGHSMTCLDWELGQLWRNMKRKYSDEEEQIRKVHNKWFKEFVEKKNLHFFMGTESQWGNWMIIGVYYPPKYVK